MGISAHSKHEILADIFGVTHDGICVLGLVDAKDESDFDGKLSTLKHRWNELLSSKGQENFYTWFKKYKASEMKTSMIKSVRVMAGSGENPPPFYTRFLWMKKYERACYNNSTRIIPGPETNSTCKYYSKKYSINFDKCNLSVALFLLNFFK